MFPVNVMNITEIQSKGHQEEIRVYNIENYD